MPPWPCGAPCLEGHSYCPIQLDLKLRMSFPKPSKSSQHGYVSRLCVVYTMVPTDRLCVEYQGVESGYTDNNRVYTTRQVAMWCVPRAQNRADCSGNTERGRKVPLKHRSPGPVIASCTGEHIPLPSPPSLPGN